MIEMTLPSSLDPTLAPAGCHVALLFTQYTAYELRSGPWTQQDRETYARRVSCLDPLGFRSPPHQSRRISLFRCNILVTRLLSIKRPRPRIDRATVDRSSLALASGDPVLWMQPQAQRFVVWLIFFFFFFFASERRSSIRSTSTRRASAISSSATRC